MGNIANQELKDDNEAQVWEPPKDELGRSVADHIDDSFRFSKQCFFGKSEDANIKRLKQLAAMQEGLNSKFKVIVSNLLHSAGVSSSSCSHWIEIITKLSWEAAEILNPFINGDPIDPNAYIKVKCIATGSCNESQVFKGLVFTKHAAHKQMKTKYEHPRILLVKGELGQHLSGSLSSLNRMAEERGYMHERRFIEDSGANVILVEKSVSRDLLEYILRRGFTLVSDMNIQRLQKISSSIGSPIAPSDSLLSHKVKHYRSFRIENIFEEHNGAGENGKKKSKSLMFLEGDPNSLGCTILLKGSNNSNLKRAKRVVEYSVLLAYHLNLKTSFLLDQQAMLSTTRLSPQVLYEPRVSICTKIDDDIEPDLDSPSIKVLVSKRNARKGIICDPSHFLNITFYENVDVPLEKFLRDMFNLQGNRCNACEELPQAHFYYYEYRKIQLRIQLKRLPVGKRLPGETNGNIWMWSRRRRGENDVTKKVMMSNAARCLSFGKFLELEFSQQTLLNRSSSCGDSFLYFYGLGYMVAMLSYSQVATYTVVLPPPKLEVSISPKTSWLDKEFRSVITKGMSMFDEVTEFLKQLRLNGPPSHQCSFKNHSNIEEMLKEERLGFKEYTMNGFDNAKTTIGVGFHKLLRLNRVWWEIFLQALVWNYRLQSLVLHDYGSYVHENVFIDVSSEEEVDRNAPVIESSEDFQTSIASNGSWFWKSFEELRSKRIVDIEKEYMSKSKIVSNFSQESLLIVNKIITEEGSRFRISLRDDYCVVSEYEDELSSLIACALACLSSDETIMPLTRFDKDQVSKQSVSSESPKFESSTSPEILVTFGLVDSHGRPKYSVVSLYAKDFGDFRNHCCISELDYIDSLSRCEQWDYAKEGKEKSIYFKTLNERFIIKEIKRIEYESFVKFGPEYFKYLKETYDLGNQTCLAKVFGIYQVNIRQSNGHKEIRYNLMVMENINFGRNISHEYNLKGPLLTQFTTTSDDDDEELLLGPRFFKDMNNCPVYFSQDSKDNLQSAVTNDINFLHSINVMDYSLLVGVDMERRQLVCGNIDYFKQYTWDMTYPPCHIL